jgi:hypothetical protein
MEDRLRPRFQRQRDHRLRHSVTDARYAENPRPATMRLRYLHRTHRGVSSLLRAGPPARAATVLNTSGFGRPVLSLFTHPPGNRTSGSIDTRLPTFHAEAAVRARAASMPDTAWPIHGHPPGSSRRHLTAPVLMPATCFDTSTAVHSRSPSRTPPDALKGAPSPRRSPRQSSANAARGGLKPPTARRLRGATKPSSPAQHRFQQGHLHNQTSPSALVAHLKIKLR